MNKQQKLPARRARRKPATPTPAATEPSRRRGTLDERATGADRRRLAQDLCDALSNPAMPLVLGLRVMEWFTSDEYEPLPPFDDEIPFSAENIFSALTSYENIIGDDLAHGAMDIFAAVVGPESAPAH